MHHLFLAIGLLLVSGVVSAQGTPIQVCPGGQTIEAHRSCDDLVRRAPDPPYYGAVALDAAHGIAGYASRDTDTAASAQAMSECRQGGGTQCEVVRIVTNKCIAVAAVISNGTASNITGDTANAGERAVNNALKKCNRSANGATCEVWIAPFCAKATPWNYVTGAAMIKRAMGQDPNIENTYPHREYSGHVSAR